MSIESIPVFIQSDLKLDCFVFVEMLKLVLSVIDTSLLSNISKINIIKK